MKRIRESFSESIILENDIEDYEIIKKVGNTYAGPVYHVQNKNENHRDYLMFKIEKIYSKLSGEIERLMNLHDQTGMLIIFGLVNSNEENGGVFLITEYAPNGCLSDIIDRVGFLETESIINPLQLACLMFSLSNSLRILHSENIFFNFFDPSFIYLGPNYELKLANPGITAFFNPDAYKSEEESSQLYLAPELYQGQKPSIYSDVYSYGSLLYQLYSTEIRFPKSNQDKTFMENILNGTIPLFPTPMPVMVRNTITQCWSTFPLDRPFFKVILQNMFKNPEFFFNLQNPRDFHDYQRSLISPEVIHGEIFARNPSRSSVRFKKSPSSPVPGRIPRSQSEPSIKTINPNAISMLSAKGKSYANKIIGLQLLVMGLNSRNFESSRSSIIRKFEGEKPYTIVSMCILASQCRYNKIYIFAQVLSLLYSLRSKHKNFAQIPDVFMNLLWESLIQGETFPRDVSKICLLSFCRIQGMYTDERIVTFIRMFFDKCKKTHKKAICLLFAWFGPQIEKIDVVLSVQIKKIFEEIQSYPNLPYAFNHFYRHMDDFAANDWVLQRNSVEDNDKSGKCLSYILRHDENKVLKYYDTNKKIFMNKRIFSEIFCPCNFVHDKPTMIMYAAAYGAENCFQYMQTKKAAITGKDDKYRTIANFAVLGGNLTIVQFIQSTGDPFDSGLQCATLMHHYSLFSYLIKSKKVDLDEPDKFDKKVITTAAAANNLCVFLHCLKNGIKLDTHETFGWTPLHTAAEKGNVEMIKLILYCQNWDPNIKDTWGATPLHLATDRLHTEAVRVFLKKKIIDVNVVNEKNVFFLIFFVLQNSLLNCCEIWLFAYC